jgi:apolipoprotein N-acyltransferase
MLGAGLLGAAAFPPLGLWPLALVSIALFLLLLRDEPSARARPLGLVYGLAYGLGTMYWFFGIFDVLAVALIALMAAYFGLLATLVGMTRGRPLWVRCLLVALFAVAVEWLRGDAWYLRFPWYTPPHALAASPAWIAPARWLGVYGLSLALWFIAAAGALGRAYYWLAFLLVPACSFLLPAVNPPDRKAVLVQAEEPQPIESVLADIPSEPVDLVVLPEFAFPFSREKNPHTWEIPTDLARRLRCPIVFGTIENGELGEPQTENVAAVLDAEGNLVGTFPKQHPVPLMLDGRPGTRRPVFTLDQGTLGIGICYDFDAPEVAGTLVGQGATLLVAPTMDVMSWGRSQHLHHELLARLRAVENDRWLLRAVSSGRSEAIDPHGVPSQEGIVIGDTGIVQVGYAHITGTTLGSRAYLLGPAAAGLAAVVLLGFGIQWLRDRRKVSPPAPPQPSEPVAPSA